jgi:hypothetical protein
MAIERDGKRAPEGMLLYNVGHLNPKIDLLQE